MNNGSESHFVAHGAVAFDECLNSPDGGIDVLEVLSLIEVADHLPDVIGSVAELGEFPVDDEETSRSSFLLLDFGK